MEEEHSAPVPEPSVEHSPKNNRKPSPEAASGDVWHFLADLIKTVLIVGVAAFVIRTYLLQPFIVEGSSMFPGLHNQDYLLVDKLSYRLHEPQRGDVVVFRYPLDPTYNYVKRIIGLPGEKIHIENNTVFVINSQHPQGVALTEPYVSSGNKTLPSSTGQTDFTVDANSYFVLGDNRMQSSDSREWGLMPKDDMIGRAVLLAYPLNRFTVVSHASYNGISGILLPRVWAATERPIP